MIISIKSLSSTSKLLLCKENNKKFKGERGKEYSVLGKRFQQWSLYSNQHQKNSWDQKSDPKNMTAPLLSLQNDMKLQMTYSRNARHRTKKDFP